MAIVIPCISDDMVEVKMKDTAKLLSLQKEHVYQQDTPL